MNKATTVDHVENIPDGASVNILTRDGDVYAGYLSAGICVSNKNICLLLFKQGKTDGDVCVPIRDIKDMEIIQ